MINKFFALIICSSIWAPPKELISRVQKNNAPELTKQKKYLIDTEKKIKKQEHNINMQQEYKKHARKIGGLKEYQVVPEDVSDLVKVCNTIQINREKFKKIKADLEEAVLNVPKSVEPEKSNDEKYIKKHLKIVK